VPSGQVSLPLVWRLGWVWLGLGLCCFALISGASLILALALTALIILYNAIHKRTPLAVILMGACRFLLYVLGSAAATGISGLAIWGGLALAAYVSGLSYLARKESLLSRVQWWPVLTLATPIGLALLANGPEYRERVFYLSLLLVIWILPSLRFVFRKEAPQIGFAVANLLAGIVLVDIIATVGEPPVSALVFAGLFLLALVLQRYVPAT
jgi:4-hydroxybenzoate polyprenyltransferase